MMIDKINKFLKDLDSRYINMVKKTKYQFFYFIELFYDNYVPIYLYKINRFIKKIFLYNYLKKTIRKYEKIKYNIFNYTKNYNKFEFKQYIKYILLKDFENIVQYYTNLFSINKWKYNVVLLILILCFYSVLLLSNKLLYFFIIKLVFYSLKYVLKYIFILIDYLFYTYINFTRIPKILFGLPYLIIVKNIYKLYYIIFNILPLLVFSGYWLYIYNYIQDWFVRKIHRVLDFIEYSIISFARSRLVYLIKRSWFYVNFYWTVEGELDRLIDRWKKNLKIYYRDYIKYSFLLYIYYSNIYIYFRYVYNSFIKNTYKKVLLIEFYIYLRKYLKYSYSFIYIYKNIYYLNILYLFYIYKIKFFYGYQKLLVVFNARWLYRNIMYIANNIHYTFSLSRYYICNNIIFLYNTFLFLSHMFR